MLICHEIVWETRAVNQMKTKFPCTPCVLVSSAHCIIISKYLKGRNICLYFFVGQQNNSISRLNCWGLFISISNGRNVYLDRVFFFFLILITTFFYSNASTLYRQNKIYLFHLRMLVYLFLLRFHEKSNRIVWNLYPAFL